MLMQEDQRTVHDPRWQAVIARDAKADGSFVYAVRTTGVYCRPSCPSRRARPENVVFFPNGDEAERKGFRPCLRCNPRGQSSAEANAVLIAAACRMIEAAETPPGTEELARRIGLSPFHFHRQFKALTGTTPAAYARAHRAGLLRQGLTGGQSITAAIHEAGFGSSSRFYEDSTGMLGMTPTTYRKGGKDAEIRFALAQCSLGALLVACTDKGVCAISLGDDPEPLLTELQARFPNALLIGDDPGFEDLVAKVVGFIEAPQIGLDLPLDIRGTAFQQRVWNALRNIAPGKTVSYAELAGRIGSPDAVRAVAGACAANKIAVAIPCHRVVRTGGSISGYRWGVERKRELLRREAEGKG
ncbi:bifunctional DNA-binding transcriptional regulator/O6-methylguanine-DNA methyltransferase Ada [Paracoccus sp. MBLB3053]|uniref:Bifunctional DNA-binding transcriptional regulator/O6-methylguanine-DNA methyltransferase Ada n=1 Tax=Paracoccus aurantius TaxID=3073814 RepID=A0ABU2HXS0_9RHOB|nr:bifunctional DNA-binding transcriptional regulator/O6-methylguanine-DNA methyltransferase Ada [Paracoccus sp. MBLB3053]MDS9469099.1 bifunctional DNA-binding transcriptional regulator/O6-methylguanine-DNA methyltransferase Ada [Paracoccus sp. MBLB3053]